MCSLACSYGILRVWGDPLRYGEEIDLLSFSQRTMDSISDPVAELTAPPDDGVYVYGQLGNANESRKLKPERQLTNRNGVCLA